uniref:Pleckstrin homology domain containing, family G (with RhoGef domain) member 2 n=1 Tax=Gasterosteus aculeatus aculeatus TaxID=481459 RepID=A0AAQ4RT13_GASAC
MNLGVHPLGSSSVGVLRDCMKNKSLVPFFQERQTTLNHSLPLETYLLKPVQRILKYHLLLQELSKHFDKSDSGYEVIEDAIITMTAVAWYINDMKRKQEHAVRLQEIESLLVNWSGPALRGFGELVLEGSFRVQRVKKERAFFLFDTMLLIAKKRLDMFVYSTHIFCCNLLLVETLKDSLCFKVSDQTIPKLQHVVQTKNQEEKRLWVHYLKRLIVENHPASLPQKARQVLGDDFCPSPCFEREDPKKKKKKSAAPLPRPDDVHSFQRGRRQSEPPELMLYTPEKSRKSLPLLLEGNLPCRRTRRQSAPAKDIEAAFSPQALKAGSEGELSQAGSGSTMASFVTQGEANRAGPVPQLRPSREEEEEDEEELIPLSPPPTLSITEEILEFINRSRAREGLTAITTHATPKESHLSSIQTNFTSPLPPPPCPSSPEQRPTMHQEQEKADTEKDNAFRCQTGGLAGKGGLQNERTVSEVQEMEMWRREMEEEEGDGGGGGAEVVVLGKEEEKEKTRDEGGETHVHVSDLHPSISAENEGKSSLRKDVIIETPPSFQCSDTDPPHHPSHKEQPRTRGSKLTKRDQKIIEKIRSYYEAAAEAGENQEKEEGEEEQGEGGSPRRRNSFSHIPSGLVKESVSRFDVSGHQGELEGKRGEGETKEVIDKDADPKISSFTPLTAEVENEVQAEEPISTSDLDSEGTAAEIQNEEPPNQENLRLSPNCPVEEDSVFPIQDGKVCKGPLEEATEEAAEEAVEEATEKATEEPQKVDVSTVELKEEPTITKQHEWKEEPIKTSPGNTVDMNGHEPNPAGTAESKEIPDEPPPPLSATEPCQKNGDKTQPTWTTTKRRDLEGTNLEGLIGQIKVGRWSRHSRIVTANRVLFEGLGSDVAGIGLFEAGPVVDPMLMENSERILSKVQTIARMYGTKVSTMKVPLHQKRASNVWNQSSCSGRFSGYSTQSQSTQSQTPTKCGTQTKFQSQTGTHIHNQSQIWSPTHYENQNQTRTGPSWEDRAIQEDRSIKSWTNDLHEESAPPQEPVLLVKDPVCPRQTNAVTLSRPRDFISALAKDRECPSTDNVQTSSMLSASRDGVIPPENQGPRICCSASNCSLMSTTNPACRVPEITDLCSTPSSEKEEAHSYSGEISADNIEKYGDVLASPECNPPTGRTEPKVVSAPDRELVPGLPADQIQRAPEPNSRMLLHSSSVVFGEAGGPSQRLTFDPSWVTAYTEAAEGQRLSGQNFNPVERLPTFTSRRPDDLPRGLQDSPSPQEDKLPSACSLRHRSPSPVRALPCSSPFSVVPASSPASPSAPTTPPSPRAESSSPFWRSSSMRAGPPSPLRSSPVASSSTFTRSLAASCISQSISQSMAKNCAPPTNRSPASTSHPRRRSPSPKPLPGQQVSGSPAYAQLGCSKDGHHFPRGRLSSPWSSCPPSSLCPSPRSSFLHSKTDSNANSNNNNSSTVATTIPPGIDPVWSVSHNRVARPFSASEPSSRVQSPSPPSPIPTSFNHFCSPPPQLSCASLVASKPPHPRGSVRAGGLSPRNPLGLTLELPRSTPGLGPRVLSPPPIGVPPNMWTSDVAAPQPRNASFPSSSLVPPRSPKAFPMDPPQPLRRSHSSNMADRLPQRSGIGGVLESWPTGSGWSSCGSSPSHLIPQARVQTPLSPGGLGGQNFTVPCPDVRELSIKYRGGDGLRAASYSPLTSLPPISPLLPRWGDPEMREGDCRSQLICAYVGHTSSSPLLSPPPLRLLLTSTTSTDQMTPTSPPHPFALARIAPPPSLFPRKPNRRARRPATPPRSTSRLPGVAG